MNETGLFTPNFLLLGEENIVHGEKKMTKRFAPLGRRAFKTGRMRVPERIREDRSNVSYIRAKATFPLQQDTDDGALRPRLYRTWRERASEQASEDIHTTRIHASCRVRLDESNRETRSYLALIAYTTIRAADHVYLCAACLIRSTSNYHISITSIEFVISSIDGVFIIKRKFLYIERT